MCACRCILADPRGARFSMLRFFIVTATDAGTRCVPLEVRPESLLTAKAQNFSHSGIRITIVLYPPSLQLLSISHRLNAIGNFIDSYYGGRHDHYLDNGSASMTNIQKACSSHL